MKRVLNTLSIFLRQEWITVSVYLVATVLFLFIIFTTGVDAEGESKEEHQRITILMISMLSIFVGLYLGSGFLRLKQSYLWQSLLTYRVNLVVSFIVGAAIYGLVQLIAMRYAGWSWAISLFVPWCVTLLAAQLVIGNNLVMKCILPASPFIIFQLTRFNVDMHLLLIVLILFASLAIYLNFNNKKALNDSTLGLMSGNLEQQMKSYGIQRLNNLIGDLFLKLGFKNRSKDLSVALMQPNNRYGVSTLIIANAILLVFYFMGQMKIEIEGLAALMLVSILIGIFIELKMLARQCKPFAHIYSGENFIHFKTQVLFMLQKHLLVQASLLVATTLFLNLFLSDFVEPLTLIKYVFAVAVVAIVFLPAMLCLNWFTINFKLLGVVIAYVALAVISCGWFYNFESSNIFIVQLTLTAIALITVRYLAKRWWNSYPMEQFMRVYG